MKKKKIEPTNDWTRYKLGGWNTSFSYAIYFGEPYKETSLGYRIIKKKPLPR